MSTRQIKALLVLKGIKNKDIAEANGVTETWVSLVLNGRRKSPRIREAISRAVGIPVEDLWPNGNNKAA